MQDDNIRSKIESKIEDLRLMFNDFIVTGQSRVWQNLAEYDVVPVSVASVLVNKGDQSTLDELEQEAKDALAGIQKIQDAVLAHADDKTVMFLADDLKRTLFVNQQSHAFELLRDNDLAEKGLPAKTTFQKMQDKTWFKAYASVFDKFSNLIKDNSHSTAAADLEATGALKAKALPCFSGDYVRASSVVVETVKSLKNSLSKLDGMTALPLIRKLAKERVDNLLNSYSKTVEQNQTLGRVDLDFGEWYKRATDLYGKANAISERLALGITLKIPKISDFSQDFIKQFASADYKEAALARLDDERYIIDYSTNLPQDVRNQEMSKSVAYIAEHHPELVSHADVIKPDFSTMEFR